MPFCCVEHLSDALANFPALVVTSATPVLHVCLLPIAACHKGLFWLTVATLVTNDIVKITQYHSCVPLGINGVFIPAS